MSMFLVQYGYDTGDDNEGFIQFWDVISEEKSFRCKTELEAVELCRILNSHDDLVAALKACRENMKHSFSPLTVQVDAALAKAEDCDQ